MVLINVCPCNAIIIQYQSQAEIYMITTTTIIIIIIITTTTTRTTMMMMMMIIIWTILTDCHRLYIHNIIT